MSRLGPRDVERRLEQLEAEEPPPGLLALLKADIPAELPVSSEPRMRPAAPEERAAGWPGRRSWLAAALLVTTLGGGWLALQMRDRLPPLVQEAPARTAHTAQDSVAGAPVPPGAPPAAGPGSAAGVFLESKDEIFERRAEAEAEARPAPAPAAPRVSQPIEVERGVEGGVVGGVVGGVPGGSPGGTPGGMMAPEPRPESSFEVSPSVAPAPPPPPRPQERETAKEESAAKPSPSAAARPPADRRDLDDSPLRLEEPLERQRQEEKLGGRGSLQARGANAGAGVATESWLARFDALPPLAAGRQVWQVQATALPSALLPGTFWLRVEAGARQGRSGEGAVGRAVELTVEPQGAPVGLRALGGARQRELRQGLAGGGPVEGGARWLSYFAVEPPRGGRPYLQISLRYREIPGGWIRTIGDTLFPGRSPAGFADASPEERLLALALDYAHVRERPVRRELLEIARLADRLEVEARGRSWEARAGELADLARQSAVSAPR